MRHVLVVRLDSLGDMVVCGPAVRAVAAGADRVTVLAGPAGAAAARLLPGVDEVLTWTCPWIVHAPPAVDPDDVAGLVERLRGARIDEALILTSFHQSALPTALVLRLAGIARIAAVSTDYPGALLDVRLPEPADGPEPLRMLEIARGAGYDLPAGDDARLRVVAGAPPAGLPADYLVVHPGTAAPARSYPPRQWADVVRALTASGWQVLVTGSAAERELTAAIAAAAVEPGAARDCAGAFDPAALAAVLARAAAVLVANTGPAHLAAAVGTPVVSLFAPVVPATRWAPYGTRSVVLGDQDAACRGTRATVCPVAGHPCLGSVTADDVLGAVKELTA